MRIYVCYVRHLQKKCVVHDFGAAGREMLCADRVALLHCILLFRLAQATKVVCARHAFAALPRSLVFAKVTFVPNTTYMLRLFHSTLSCNMPGREVDPRGCKMHAISLVG